jgi:hypothetical protein
VIGGLPPLAQVPDTSRTSREVRKVPTGDIGGPDMQIRLVIACSASEDTRPASRATFSVCRFPRTEPREKRYELLSRFRRITFETCDQQVLSRS